MTPTVAALFVQEGGAYYDVEGVDPWPEARDARTYDGPHPVVAHPPCQRWGNFWYGSPSSEARFRLGDDRGCFAAALWSVRTFGGVLEHPAHSRAWQWFGLGNPLHGGGWRRADGLGGWTCEVEQGHYGHRARKSTWLYVAGATQLPELRWGANEKPVIKRRGIVHYMSKRQRAATPEPFRDLLLGLARGARGATPWKE